MSGKVWLVGAGPGAPDLLTVRALRVLERAQIVFHDALVDPRIVALTTTAEQVAVGKRCGGHSTAQRFINKRLIDAAQTYETVVRLKGGDPMLFGRAQEEIDALLAAGVAVEVVPGVTSAFAASADSLRSLTARGVARSVTFVTPRVGEGEDRSTWVRAAVAADTAVIYMASHEAAAIGALLIEHGLAAHTPVAIVENASLAQRQILAATLATLGQVAQRLHGGPALIVVGENFRAIV
ncbi:MAG: uroporphyrinogen-III C-methyltransferase, partial [Proteobacteria bacterium]|nr:uroporphyrinogen-III C-methyltransferase [Burkholderiales bacterium]